MTKRLVDIDDQLLERARAASGETTIRGTVKAGLERLANDELLDRHMARLRRGAFELSPEEMRALRDPDFPLRADDDA